MSRLDLPVELWLHIFSYLPPRSARKYIDVSRALFQLGLNDIYGQIDIVNDDEKTRSRLNQLMRRDLSNRVRHLHINLEFLPQNRPLSQKTPFETGSIQKWVQTKIKALGSRQTTQSILRFASSRLLRCKGLRQITIILHDSEANNDLLALLDAVVVSVNQNPQIAKLVIDAPVSNLPGILRPFIYNPQVLNRLRDLEIVLNGKYERRPPKYMSSLHSLTCIVSTSRDTLQSFRFSSSVEVNLDRYLATLPQLPKLRILEICSTNISWTFPTRNGIFDFIQKHSSQLEQLELLPTPPQNYPIGTSSQTEIFFFSPHHQPAISQIHFANVTSFHIGIPDRSRTRIRHENPLPPLASTMPNLTSLTLDTGFKLSFSALKDLIDGLPSQNGILGLRRLRFSCHTLDPQVLDTLASRLPSLQSLTINYQFLTMGSATDASPRPPQTVDVIWLPFVMAMKTHKYTSWWINELRIARINPDSECSVPHPALPAMAAVASSLPLGRQVYLDRSFVCGCVPK